jgi:hypothetical protein
MSKFKRFLKDLDEDKDYKSENSKKKTKNEHIIKKQQRNRKRKHLDK